MSKYNWKKYQKNKKVLWNENPCSEVLLTGGLLSCQLSRLPDTRYLEEWSVSPSQMYNIGDWANATANTRPGSLSSEPGINTTDIREAGQALPSVRPSGTMSTIIGDHAAGIEPAYSDVYRRRDYPIGDTIDRHNLISSGRRAGRTQSTLHAAAIAAIAYGRDSTRTLRHSFDSDLDERALRRRVREGNCFVADPEESSDGSVMAQLYQGHGVAQVRSDAS